MMRRQLMDFSRETTLLRGAVSVSGWRAALWPVLLIAATVACSLHFACAVPLAALAAITALTVRRQAVLPVVGAIWLSNQLVGFLVLDYPWTADCLYWGVAMGVATILAALAAQFVRGRLAHSWSKTMPLLAIGAAIVVFELSLLVTSVAVLGGGTRDFTMSIMAYVLMINAAAFAGLLALHRVGSSCGVFAVQPPIDAAELHAQGATFLK